MGLVMLAVFLPIISLGLHFSRRQERLNRAMDAMDDSRQDAGYVGPHLPGPF
ncbi:hypothetical protein [uncultured Deinococcus sp.]|uniref:hypothetical protein n=1 Tax=uncultured Deinococcus sp. TaxID=158789 RepID=UPI0025E62E57|nr:hypothetical protein [uncultured Deinococcus sp.]